MHPTLRSRARNVFGVQLYKKNARALFAYLEYRQSRWLQHAPSVCGEYACVIKSNYSNFVARRMRFGTTSTQFEMRMAGVLNLFPIFNPRIL